MRCQTVCRCPAVVRRLLFFCVWDKSERCGGLISGAGAVFNSVTWITCWRRNVERVIPHKFMSLDLVIKSFFCFLSCVISCCCCLFWKCCNKVTNLKSSNLILSSDKCLNSDLHRGQLNSVPCHGRNDHSKWRLIQFSSGHQTDKTVKSKISTPLSQHLCYSASLLSSRWNRSMSEKSSGGSGAVRRHLAKGKKRLK